MYASLATTAIRPAVVVGTRHNVKGFAPGRCTTVMPLAPRPAVKAASLPTELLTIAAEVGEVDAPAWVLPAAYVVVHTGVEVKGRPRNTRVFPIHAHTGPSL